MEMPMYCNLALFQWTLFSLRLREEAGLARGRLNAASEPFPPCFSTRIGQVELKLDVSSSVRWLARGRAGWLSHPHGQTRTILQLGLVKGVPAHGGEGGIR